MLIAGQSGEKKTEETVPALFNRLSPGMGNLWPRGHMWPVKQAELEEIILIIFFSLIRVISIKN